MTHMPTNGCSLVPKLHDKVESCCNEHDEHYSHKTVSRWEADRQLRNCINAHGRFILAWTVWCAVRSAGWIFWKRQ